MDRVVKKLNKPLIIGEIGACSYDDKKDPENEKEITFLRNSLKIFNEWGLGYLGYCWSTPEWQRQFGLLRDTGFTPSDSGKVLVEAVKEGAAASEDLRRNLR